MMPVILLGCLYSGVTTAEAAGAAGRVRAARVGRALPGRRLEDVYRSLVTSSRITVSIGMLIAGALVFNYVITAENIPKTLSAMLKGYQMSPLVYLLVVNVLLLVLGCFLEGTTIILVILPVLLPPRSRSASTRALRRRRRRQHHVRLITPPYGLLLFMMRRSPTCRYGTSCAR